MQNLLRKGSILLRYHKNVTILFGSSIVCCCLGTAGGRNSAHTKTLRTKLNAKRPIKNLLLLAPSFFFFFFINAAVQCFSPFCDVGRNNCVCVLVTIKNNFSDIHHMKRWAYFIISSGFLLLDSTLSQCLKLSYFVSAYI